MITTNRTAQLTRIIIRVVVYLILILFTIFYLLPLFVMLVNSVKPLSEIRGGRMLSLPQEFTLEPWRQAWSKAQIGVQATGLRPYFWNSVILVAPSVFLSLVLGSINGYVLSFWRFKGSEIFFRLLLFSCFIPFQIVLIPSARVLGLLGLAGTLRGLILIHVIYGIGFTSLFFRNSYRSFPLALIDSAKVDGAHFFGIFTHILLPNSAPVIAVSIIWQFTNIWNDFLFGVSFGSATTQPLTVALNNLVSSSTGVKEYNVHFAGAVMAAVPTLIVYVLSGRYFVRGLIAGALKE